MERASAPEGPRPATTSAALLHPISLAVGAAITVLALVLPPSGLGIDLCMFHRATHLSCPGCGLTRSVLHAARLDLDTSVAHHPFGPLVLLVAMGLTVALVVGPSRRARLRRFLDAREQAARRVYIGLVAAFVVFGASRLALEAVALLS